MELRREKKVASLHIAQINGKTFPPHHYYGKNGKMETNQPNGALKTALLMRNSYQIKEMRKQANETEQKNNNMGKLHDVYM